MQVIPIDKDEQAIIDESMSQSRETSAVASRMFFSISPLSSPKRKDSVSINDSTTVRNFIKQATLNKLESAIDYAQEREEKYTLLQEKLNKFGY